MQNYEQSGPTYRDPRAYQYQDDVAPVMRFADWFVIMLIMVVPLLNLVMLITWALDRNSNPNRRNWALASLVFIGVQAVVAMFILGMFMGSIMHLMSGLQPMGTW